MELVDFLTLYGIFNLGIHISMFLVSFNINSPTRDNFDSEPESDLEPEPDLDSEYSDPDDPDYNQPSDLKMNLRKRKTI
jgi:hypothetical protein